MATAGCGAESCIGNSPLRWVFRVQSSEPEHDASEKHLRTTNWRRWDEPVRTQGNTRYFRQIVHARSLARHFLVHKPCHDCPSACPLIEKLSQQSLSPHREYSDETISYTTMIVSSSQITYDFPIWLPPRIVTTSPFENSNLRLPSDIPAARMTVVRSNRSRLQEPVSDLLQSHSTTLHHAMLRVMDHLRASTNSRSFEI